MIEFARWVTGLVVVEKSLDFKVKLGAEISFYPKRVL